MERAAISLAVAVVSPIISKLSTTAASYFGGDITAEEHDRLRTIILPKIQAVIKAAETIKSEELKPWLVKLKVAAYEARDVLDEYEYESIRSKVSHLHNSLKIFKGIATDILAPVSIRTALKKSLDKLQQSADEASQLIPLIDIISKTTPQSCDTAKQHHDATVSGLSSPVFGRDEERESLVRLLIDEPDESSSNNMSVPVLALQGIGGAGKSTLARYICADPRVEAHFPLKMWVHVSCNLDVHRATKEIIESAVEGGCPSVGNLDVGSLDVLQKKLEKTLKSKKFLLVLDDVWCQNSEQWDQLLMPLNAAGKAGSKILITTRADGVASKLGVKSVTHLKELTTDDCWSIMKHYAFGDANRAIEDTELERAGKQIVDKLKNSPLGARVVGSSLRQKMDIDEWKMLLRDDDVLKDIMNNVLFLSFQHLPPHLQRCFAFCSLYPKGFLFENSEELVRLWISHGYVEKPSGNELSIEDNGRKYFNDLVSYSFFQPHHSRHGVYVIHDLLHDLAEKISEDHCFRIEGDGPVSIPTSVIHLSISTNKLAVHKPYIFKLVNLQTFIIFSSPHCEVSNIDIKEIFEKLTKLRVLHLGDNLVEELKSSIGRLKHLRYLQLQLSWKVKELPTSLCRLYHVHFIIIRGGGSIRRMPTGFTDLLNLRRLLAPYSLYDSYQMEHARTKAQLYNHPHGSFRVRRICLQRRVEVSASGTSASSYQMEHELPWKLCIQHLESVRTEADARGIELKDKLDLDELTLTWDISRLPEREDQDEAVIEGLEPPHNLEHLCIEGYYGTKLPCWMLSDRCCFSNLQCLELSRCHNLLRVTHLPLCVKELKVEHCDRLRDVSSLPHGLQELSVEFCPSLILRLPPVACGLQRLNVYKCMRIENLLYQASSIEELVIDSVADSMTTLNAILRESHSLDHLSVHQSLEATTSLLLGPNLTTLRVLEIVNEHGISCIEGIGSLPHLWKLTIVECPNLTSVGNLHPRTLLVVLTVARCPLLTTRGGGGGGGSSRRVVVDEILLLPVLLGEQGLNSVEKLEIMGCRQHTPFSDEQQGIVQHLTSLVSLSFQCCYDLPSLPANLENLSSLECLDMLGCCAITSLPDLPISLQSLNIHQCAQLGERYGEGGPLHHKIQYIPSTFIDGRQGISPGLAEQEYQEPEVYYDATQEFGEHIEDLIQ